MEVACNLLDPGVTSPEAVLAVAASKAAELGIGIEEAYRIGLGPDEILAETLRRLEQEQQEQHVG